MMRWVERDGVLLWCDDVLGGDPPIVFVHGFAADHHHFAPQAAHFAGRYRTVAVDLRGHGRSDAPAGEYTMEGFADDVAFVCEALGLERPVVVGHSMGGVISSLVAQRHPQLVGGLVVVDSAIVPRPELVGALVGWADMMRQPDYRERLREVSDAFFSPYDDPVRTRGIQDGMLAPQHVLVSSAEHLGGFVERAVAGFDEEVVGGWRCPAALIAAQFHMNDIDRFLRLAPTLLVGQTLGSGHYVCLEVPDQVNAMLDRFLHAVTGGPS
jgi:pimeloyl-ACP methyl ester carboxylesterase